MAESAGKQRASRRGSIGTAAAEENGRGESVGTAQSMTDLDFLRGLIDAVDRSGIDTLEINRAGTRIRIVKTPAASANVFPSFPTAAAAPPPALTAVSSTSGSSAPARGPEAIPELHAELPPPKSNLVDVKSPMVGTFYRAPAPDAPPYVETGAAISRGQTLCILEAMKLMNELQSEVDGTLREVLVEDADPVEYGQVLFRIEPSGSK